MRYLLTVILCLILSSTVLSAQSDILDVRTNYSIGETVTVTGIITSGASLGSVRYVQDASAGIALYPGNDWTAWDLEPNPGDEVNVTGIITEYNGLLEIGPNLTNVDVLSSGNPIPDALVVTPNQLNESLEGQLVVIEGATFDAGGQTIEANATYTFTSSGEEGFIYVRSSNSLVGTTLNECEMNLMGIVSQYSFVGYGGYQLLPRGAADMISTSGVCDADELLGCTNPTASNYDPDATEDDGSCCYAELGDEWVQLGQDIDEEIVNSQTFSLLGSFESKQYYISDNPINISDNFYEEFNALAISFGGNLLSINSFEENEFIYDSFVNQFSSSSYYYIGLFNTAPSNLCCGQGNPPGVWEWISGEDVVYTNWDINNNQPSGDELHASGSVSLGGLWIDVSGGGHSGHIILEIDLCVLFISGCMDTNACNYNPEATEDDGSCDYSCCPGPGCCHEGTYWDEEAQQCLLDITFCSWQPDSNADGNIGIGDLLDLLSVFGDTDYDEDGVFDSVDDCVDPEACNYQANPTEPCYYIDVLGVCGGGCVADEDEDAICDDIDDCIGVVDECGVCNGPGPIEVVIESITILYDSVYLPPLEEWYVYEFGADTTFSFTCEPVFNSCGDDIEHDGYDYSTVLIGDQCWFSENCRYLPSVSLQNEGSEITPYYYVYGYSGNDLEIAKNTTSYQTYGTLYNRSAITQDICPNGWHVPSHSEFLALSSYLGEEAGDAMKSESPFWNGNNSSGFSGLPGGKRGWENVFDEQGSVCYFWTSSGSTFHELDGSFSFLGTSIFPIYYGLSARCIKD